MKREHMPYAAVYFARRLTQIKKAFLKNINSSDISHFVRVA